jgi:O-antigen/teichoic acid export membrane protein
LLIIPIIIGVFYLGGWILSFIYNINSIESFIAFKILIVAELFVFLTMIMGQFIAALDKQKIFAYIGGIGAVVNVILNFVLIPRFSLYGAGYATLITYFLMFVLMYIYIKKNLLNFRFFRYLIVPMVGSLVMWLVLVNVLGLHLFWIVLVCLVVYGVVVIGFNLKE